MKKFLTLCVFVLLLCSVHAQTPKYFLPNAYFTVDTGICKINTPVLFKFRISIKDGYLGMHFKWILDYGDGNSISKRDTMKNLGIDQFGYENIHTYTSASNKDVKLFLLDSADRRIDSFFITYNIGGCVSATGLMYSDSKVNCIYDYGEAIYGYNFLGVSNHGIPRYYQLDSLGSYNIPVFPGDTLLPYSFVDNCGTFQLDTGNLHADVQVAQINPGYFDTTTFPKYVCQGQYYRFLYTGAYPPTSGGGILGVSDYHVRFNLGYESYWYPFTSVNASTVESSFRFDSSGYFPVTFEMYYRSRLLWRTMQWVHVEKCKPATVNLYYDINENCVKDAWEPTVNKAISVINPTIAPYQTYASDTIGKIHLVIYPGDTLKPDGNTYYTYQLKSILIDKSLKCPPSNITEADSEYYFAFNPRYVTGSVFTDTNSNCKRGPGEKGISGQTVMIKQKGMVKYAVLTDSAGYYKLPIVALDSYTVSSQSPTINGLSKTCSGDSFAVITYGDTVVRNFGYQCGNTIDAGITMYHNNFVKNGIDMLYINVETVSCLSGSGVLTVFMDTLSTCLQSSLTPASIGGNQIVYNIADLASLSNKPLKITYKIADTAKPGATLCYSAHIVPSFTDTNMRNNITFLCDSVKASLPDNFKSISVQDDTTGNISFVYTIGFTNKDTINRGPLVIIDTLDKALDVSTAMLLESNMPVIFKKAGNVLSFEFVNLLLPPYTSDSINSKVFVRFKVRPIMPIASVIANYATYYVDTLPGTQSNVVYYPTIAPPPSLHVSGMPAENDLINVYPNPAKDILFIDSKLSDGLTVSIISIEGRVLKTAQAKNGITSIQIRDLPVGSYILTVVSNDKTIVGRQLIIKQ